MFFVKIFRFLLTLFHLFIIVLLLGTLLNDYIPPSNNHPEAERAKYQAIGESDRMTLRFVKRAGN